MAPKTNGIGVQVEDMRICVVMVGLPARGKSYIAQKGELHILSLHPNHYAIGARCGFSLPLCLNLFSAAILQSLPLRASAD